MGTSYGFLSVILVDAGRRGFLHRHEFPVVLRRATVMFIVNLHLTSLAQSDGALCDGSNSNLSGPDLRGLI